MVNFTRPLIMGVINITPDSFSDGGQFLDTKEAVKHALELVAQGANIIDLGGESTRPGALRVKLEDEQARVLPVIKELAANAEFKSSGAIISIDTMNAQTAALAVAAGASIVNDVSGGLADEQMFAALKDLNCKFIISHWRGFSETMDSMNNYTSVAIDVAKELTERVAKAQAAGISKDRLIIDPGLGFAKDIAQNWHLVARLDELEKLGLPILVGASRKRFLAGALEPEDAAGVSNQRRDLATAVLTALLLQRKLWGVRVHNVSTTLDAIKVVEALAFANEESNGQS
ncbi:MAG: dihydropteroate synthase [Actinobacteria bacterium]|uniref:dihydropteroate synthase n=1 Tax=freshwater metagenome TaxID=449393 RepID=A0A6J6MGV4_9ZZZZ|nr:dihydropteroate synthase [Actinomycetota bacterium]